MTNCLKRISHRLHQIQRTFFPDLNHEAGPIPETLIRLTYVLETIHSQKIFLPAQNWMGRPPKSRRGILNAFIAKAFLNMPTTKHLVERLQSDQHLRLICGFETRKSVPSESVFSRVFAEFAETELPECIHEALIKNSCAEKISEQVSRDSTTIKAREKPEKKANKVSKSPKKRRGRPRKGEAPAMKKPTRVQKQLNMTLEQMLKDLPIACDRGSKKNSQGYIETWTGYKLHIDTADNGIPVAAILTSASVHDSQAAIPLATITSNRTHNFYDLMDSAYDQKEIADYSRKLNHVPLIDVNPRRNKELKESLGSEKKARKTLNWEPAEATRYKARSGAERTNARLKDEFGGRTVRVRGPRKVFCHLMIGVLTLTADRLMRMIM
ncbi:MAG: hypothetical protein K1000chlam2_01196 [Chlamydiae bacterium]|nr:hypothetical protein [Chlamydiota bacterium]